MTWLLERLRAWWQPIQTPSASPEVVGRLITPIAPSPTPEQLAHHARRKRRQNAHVATQAVICGGA